MDLAVVVASTPPRYWWVAPLVTGLAVLLAFWTSLASLEQQRRSLVDNRRLRVADDVREVLAEAIRDLQSLVNAELDTTQVFAVCAQLCQNWPALNAPQQERARTALRETTEPRRLACEAASRSFDLQRERLRLLLGDHAITELANRAALRDGHTPAFTLWTAERPDNDGPLLDDTHRAITNYLIGYRDEFVRLGQQYVREHQVASPGKPSGAGVQATATKAPA